MNIILCNDDGVNSNGLITLANRLSKKHSVLVVAPDGNRSAAAHSLTINDSIKLNKLTNVAGYEIYSLSGTPVDCIKFAELNFPEFKADVVVAGINKGHNVGSDILYSGTVSIACEAAFFGHVLFAFSKYDLGDGEFEIYADYAEKIIEYFLPLSNNEDIWNVNFPPENLNIKGIKVTALGKHLYSDAYVKVGENEFKLTGEPLSCDIDEDSDVYWLHKGYITVTPIIYNRTDYNKIKEVSEKCIKLL